MVEGFKCLCDIHNNRGYVVMAFAYGMVSQGKLIPVVGPGKERKWAKRIKKKIYKLVQPVWDRVPEAKPREIAQKRAPGGQAFVHGAQPG